MHRDDSLRDQAALWAVRSQDADFTDWAGLTAWMERDPAHAAAYDAVVCAVEDAVDTINRRDDADGETLLASNDDDAPRTDAWGQRRNRWMRPALAAACAGLASLGAWQFAASPTTHATAPGEMRTIALEDGTRIDLAGNSRLVVAARDPRAATLEQGRALFHIRHNDDDPFTLTAGGATLVDAGTTFDVSLANQRIDVEVAEGAVIVNPHSVKIRLDAGERVTRRGGDWRVTPVDSAAVGEWRRGRIVFRDANVSEIADQLRSATGLRFIAGGTGGGAGLSGSVDTASLRQNPAALGPLLGVTVQPRGADWVIASP